MDSFTKQDGRYRCSICGASFSSPKGLNIHLSKCHPLNPPLVYPDEKVDVKNDGEYVVLTIKMKKSLWKEVSKAASELNVKIDELVFEALLLATLAKPPINNPPINNTTYIT
ncbi:MAG: C2H2-type zinc finger protein [Candidatus Jordarchaeales archaeon]